MPCRPPRINSDIKTILREQEAFLKAMNLLEIELRSQDAQGQRG
jgi:hypothetical protein